jgi:hypothetical protein
MAEVMDMTELRGILINLPILLQVKQEQRKKSVVGLWDGSKSGNRCLGSNEDRSARFK